MAARKITPADILPPAEYAAKRKELRQQVVSLKRNRRIEVGPVATFYFESFETMLQQIQEMLYIEKGGAEQIAGELAAYNPLIPNGKELTATVMFEIDDPIRRGRFLARLGGVEGTAFIKLDGETVKGVPEEDQDRTNAEGKASSVQFIHFAFTPPQIALFREPNRQVVIGFNHPEYSHMAVLPEAVRAALSQDFE
ncbi:MAG: DUF3501 family protein [Dongia sp.]